MAKLMCAKCGGKVKMAKMSKGGFAAGIPYATGAGATDGKNGMMKLGGANKACPPGQIKNSSGKCVAISGGISKIVSRKLDGIKLDGLPELLRNVAGGIGRYVSKEGGLKKAASNITKKALKNKKTGGSTKATKFAALAPPYNKATFADRIAGAKKKK